MVTLFGCDAAHPQGLLRASEICQREIEFGEVVMITERIFPGATREEGRSNYSKYIIKKLGTHFTTSHVLVINDDGYVQNEKAWDPHWLDFDYIGAPWEWYPVRCVGNGGFSLRSKRLCDILAKDNHINNFHPEDDMICRQYRPYLEEKYGIKFATIEQARQFSIEAWAQPLAGRRYNGQFGFHGFLVTDLPIPPKR